MNLNTYTKDELLMMAAITAPVPTPEDIEFQRSMDMQRNPHNDDHKPPIRGTHEIIADYKIAYAKTLFDRMEAALGKWR